MALNQSMANNNKIPTTGKTAVTIVDFRRVLISYPPLEDRANIL